MLSIDARSAPTGRRLAAFAPAGGSRPGQSCFSPEPSRSQGGHDSGTPSLGSSGSLGCRRLLVENGRLKGRQANSRYAQYLKVAASGDLGNVEVLAGREAAADLLKPSAGRPLYHLNDFSYFEPNGITGEFSTEIRFGRRIDAQGSRPVKGGSVSGLSRDALATARFSAETEQRERYLGPRLIRLQGLTLAGD